MNLGGRLSSRCPPFVLGNLMRRRLSAGWTLTEIVVAVGILALLVTLSFPAFNYLRAKMEFAACVANLKSLHAGLSVHLQDHGMVWPQYPGNLTDEGGDDEEDKLSRWWFDTLKPYGVDRKAWMCPGDREGREKDNTNLDHFSASYGVTLFDETPNSAYRWFQPWVIESGQNHGRGQGPNMIMPDGEVRQGVTIDMEPPGQSQ